MHNSRMASLYLIVRSLWRTILGSGEWIIPTTGWQLDTETFPEVSRLEDTNDDRSGNSDGMSLLNVNVC
jgi:hypothetical protein